MRRILIIDDEADIREVAALSMELFAQWEVIKAQDACEGLERAALDQPDAILLDMKMPNVDGRGTLDMLKSNVLTAHIPVLLLTAQALTSQRKQLEELPVGGVLTKPFDPRTLAEEISWTLGWSRPKPVQPYNPAPVRLAIAI
jgi:CheY-like chemotaxis protein